MASDLMEMPEVPVRQPQQSRFAKLRGYAECGFSSRLGCSRLV
jgi:hypothetical protein